MKDADWKSGYVFGFEVLVEESDSGDPIINMSRTSFDDKYWASIRSADDDIMVSFMNADGMLTRVTRYSRLPLGDVDNSIFREIFGLKKQVGSLVVLKWIGVLTDQGREECCSANSDATKRWDVMHRISKARHYFLPKTYFSKLSQLAFEARIEDVEMDYVLSLTIGVRSQEKFEADLIKYLESKLTVVGECINKIHSTYASGALIYSINGIFTFLNRQTFRHFNGSPIKRFGGDRIYTSAINDIVLDEMISARIFEMRAKGLLSLKIEVNSNSNEFDFDKEIKTLNLDYMNRRNVALKILLENDELFRNEFFSNSKMDNLLREQSDVILDRYRTNIDLGFVYTGVINCIRLRKNRMKELYRKNEEILNNRIKMFDFTSLRITETKAIEANLLLGLYMKRLTLVMLFVALVSIFSEFIPSDVKQDGWDNLIRICQDVWSWAAAKGALLLEVSER
ncbi:hypothetical protein [uncultured Maricaulis sp.]|uniref:hypothetical protein n=1 Tax=uncultured Maricaulis sp. TaxID=174710 RepID=UPI0030DB7B8A